MDGNTMLWRDENDGNMHLYLNHLSEIIPNRWTAFVEEYLMKLEPLLDETHFRKIVDYSYNLSSPKEECLKLMH